MTHRQDKKYTTEANGITEHGSNWKQTSKEHPLSPPHVSSTLSPSPLYTLLTIPSDVASCSKQMESRGQMERATNNRWERNDMHLNKHFSASICRESRLILQITDCGPSLIISENLSSGLNVLTSANCLHRRWMRCWFPYPDLAKKTMIMIDS